MEVFYLFGLFCIYSYFLYPFLLKLVPRRSPSNNGSSCDAELPSVSLIIAVHNEESRIKEKLYNSLQIEYPVELLEIIVTSDFSTDKTDSIVESYGESSVRCNAVIH